MTRAKPIEKMSDAEFLALLRRTRRADAPKGATLAEVFGDEARALERKCALLTLENVWRMLLAPIEAKEWWAPQRVYASVSATHEHAFTALTEARRITTRDDTLVVASDYTPMVRSYRVDAVDSPVMVRFYVEHDRPNDVPAHVHHYALGYALGLYLTSTKSRAASTWHTHKAIDFVHRSPTVEWERGSILDMTGEERDGESRGALSMFALSKLVGSPECAASLWGAIAPHEGTPLNGVLALQQSIRSYSSFAYEVPVDVASLADR